ncbi:hypothetical protein [Nocardiopsis ganjiahuensis]|uniref:hypothetical protein n=1 Tax=Nocardiopsis ganjiahuensis TaxID=239984 RepID=UPI00034A72C4|nr:hypothetical protein [Nocardiopsis ganjiahuensis]
MATREAVTRAASVRQAGVAVVASVLLASGAVTAGAAFSARDAIAQQATPYASSTWGQLTLDASAYGAGAVSGTLTELEVSGNGNEQWDIGTGPGSDISGNLTSATGTAEVNAVTDPESAMTNANGAFTALNVPPPTVGGAASLITRGPRQPDGRYQIFTVSTWNNRVQCAPPADVIVQDSTTAPMFLGQLVEAPAPNAPGTAVTELDFPGDYGDGVTNAHVTVTISHVYEVDDPYTGHARTDYTAVVQGEDADGNPVGAPVTLFDMTLGDVHVDCRPPEPSPSPTPTESPTPSPTPSPTESPSPSPTPSPTPSPSPSPSPTESPSPSPSPTPSPSPSPTPSPSPSPTPTPSPSPTPTSSPTPTPSPAPSPTPSPTESPSPSPSPTATPSPTASPSPGPSPSVSPSPSSPPTDPIDPVPPRPAPPADGPKLPVTGAGVAALVIGGLTAIGASAVAFAVSRKRSA